MRSAVIRFSENVLLVMGLIAATGIVVLTHYGIVPPAIRRSDIAEGMDIAGIGYVVAAFLALWSLRSLGVSMLVTPTSITRKTLLGEYRIYWNEMEYVEIGPFCWWLVFHGAGKRIWMRRPRTSAESWFRDDDDEDYEDPVLTQILEIAEANGISTASGLLTPFKTSKS